MSLSYGDLLKKSWKTIWKHKILWIFGILASCSVRDNGGFSGGSSFRGNTNNFGNFNNTAQMPPAVSQFFRQMEQMANNGQLWQTILPYVIALIVLGVVLSLIRALLGTIGQIGLINGTWQLEEGAEKVSFGALVKAGWPNFWKVILFKLLLIGVGIALAIVAILLTLVTFFCGLVLIIPALIVYAFVYWILVNYIMVAMLGDSMGIMDAIAKSWQLFKANWMTSTLMGLLVGVINFVVGLILAVPFLLAIIPGGIALVAAMQTRNYNGMVPGMIASAILLLIYALIYAFFNGIKVAYFGVNWVFVYRSLSGHDPQQAAPIATVVEPEALPDEPLPPIVG